MSKHNVEFRYILRKERKKTFCAFILVVEYVCKYMRGQFLADMLLFSLHNSTHRPVLLSTCLRAQKPLSCSYKQTLFQAQYTETRYSVFSNFIKKHRKCYEFNVIYINIIKYNIFLYLYIINCLIFFVFIVS